MVQLSLLLNCKISVLKHIFITKCLSKKNKQTKKNNLLCLGFSLNLSLLNPVPVLKTPDLMLSWSHWSLISIPSSVMELFDSSNPSVWSCHIEIAAATPYMMTLGAIWRSKVGTKWHHTTYKGLCSVNNNTGECSKRLITLKCQRNRCLIYVASLFCYWHQQPTRRIHGLLFISFLATA